MFDKEEYEKAVDSIFYSRLNVPLKDDKLKSRSQNDVVKAFTCPICMDVVESKIELNCGHKFCRECLKRASENHFNSCFLCRRSHELNPDTLKEQFDKERIVNLGWRVGWKGRGPRDHSVQTWADPFINNTSSPIHRHARTLSINDKLPLYQEVKNAAFEESKKNEVIYNSFDFKTPFPISRKSSYSIDDLDIAIDSSLRASKIEAKKLVEEVVSIEEAHNAPLDDMFEDDIGDLPVTSLKNRWGKLRSLGNLNQDVGDKNISEIKNSYKELLNLCAPKSDIFCTSIEEDVGSKNIESLKNQYKNLMNIGVIGSADTKNTDDTIQKCNIKKSCYSLVDDKDVGDKSSFELQNNFQSLMKLARMKDLDLGRDNKSIPRFNSSGYTILLNIGISNPSSIDDEKKIRNVTSLKYDFSTDIGALEKEKLLGRYKKARLSNR